MNKETRYRYEKRIRELKDENNELRFELNIYKSGCSEIIKKGDKSFDKLPKKENIISNMSNKK